MAIYRKFNYRGFEIETTAVCGIKQFQFIGKIRVTKDEVFIFQASTPTNYPTYIIADSAALALGISRIDLEFAKST